MSIFTYMVEDTLAVFMDNFSVVGDLVDDYSVVRSSIVFLNGKSSTL